MAKYQACIFDKSPRRKRVADGDCVTDAEAINRMLELAGRAPAELRLTQGPSEQPMRRVRREFALTGACILSTIICTILEGVHLAGVAMLGGVAQRLSLAIFAAIVTLLLYGGLVYQFTRAGYFWRLQGGLADARRGPAAAQSAKSLTVLIPSYKEEPGVLRQTILSAALMEYPNRRIVALLDDPPFGSAADLAALKTAREVVRELEVEFAAYAAYFAAAEHRFGHRKSLGVADLAAEHQTLAGLYEQAATWIEGRIEAWLSQSAGGPADTFFEHRIARRLAGEHRARARELRGARLDLDAVAREHRRLASLFRIDLSSFERKRFSNLSHAPNKAMNLNAYIGLLGGCFRESRTRGDVTLVACPPAEARLQVPQADYVLTLDADSLVLPDYALKLAAILDADPRIAVAQTPYSAFPGARGAVERIAGATTDLQYLAHQGSTAFRAAYWVGANAMLRASALRDIRQEAPERGHTVPVFIQDRTVIEDTGSTVDLIGRGWTLYNHPERLAYSATPADFGALSVQRRRWANGGLIILPDLIRYLRRGGPRRAGLAEALIRVHYLVSPAVANLGLLTLIVAPFDSHLSSVWLPLSAAPYYLVYGRDLSQSGYRARDLFGVYALNLVLLPVNLAGVLDSVRQLFSGRKAPFARTPKIGDRTATPVGYIAFHAAALAFLLVMGSLDLIFGRWTHAAFSAANLALFTYGFSRFVGWREAWQDLAAWRDRTKTRTLTNEVAAQEVAPAVADLAPPRELARANAT